MRTDWGKLKSFEKAAKEAGIDITVPPFKLPLSVADESILDGDGKVIAVLCFQELPEKIERGRTNAKWLATAVNSLFGLPNPICDWEEKERLVVEDKRVSLEV